MSKRIIAMELAGVTTGPLSTLVNHLLWCDFCLENVKKKAQAMKSSGKESDDDDMDSVPITTTWWSGPLLHMACMSPILL